MPHSDAEGKDIALDWYRKIRPSTVIDVGAGAGTYAKLMRNPADRGSWRAVEGWEPYIEEFGLNELYGDIVVSDVRRLNWPELTADLVIFGDILEHMTRDEAKTVLKRARVASRNIIVSIPVLHLPQGAVNGNPYERHIDHWTATDMANELADGLVESWVGNVLGYFWWRHP